MYTLKRRIMEYSSFSQEYYHFCCGNVIDSYEKYKYEYDLEFTNPRLLKYYEPPQELLFEIVLRIIDIDDPELFRFKRKLQWNSLDFDDLLCIARRIKSKEMLDVILSSIVSLDMHDSALFAQYLFKPIFYKKEIPKYLLDDDLWVESNKLYELETYLLISESDSMVFEFINESLKFYEWNWNEVLELLKKYDRFEVLYDLIEMLLNDEIDLHVEFLDLYHKPPNGRGWLKQLEDLKIEQKKYDEILG